MKNLKQHWFRLTLATACASLLLASGCQSIVNDDPRTAHGNDHSGLFKTQPSQTAWPAAELPTLKPMRVESIPDRTQPSHLYDRTPNWPPGLID
jgi:uncharacterized protein YceK